MSRMFLPSLRETFTDQNSVVEGAADRRTLEEYRLLYTSALDHAAQGNSVLLGVSSPVSGEGKTTVATNVAVAMASDLERSVLLVSCALWANHGRGSGTDVARPGLAEFVADPERDLNELVAPTPLPNLHVLFAGAQRPENPSRLVRGEHMRQALAKFREHFDITVFDMPPVLTTSDTQVLAQLLDGVMLVASMGQTTSDALRQSVRMLQRTRILGIVANRARPEMPQWMSRILGGAEWVA